MIDKKDIDGSSIIRPTFYGMCIEDFLRGIDAILSKGYCVELRPVKDGGVRVIQVIRKQVTEKPNRAPSP